jgi:hypothetical protein
MRILTGFVIVATASAAAAAGSAYAQPGWLSDVAYVQAARCAGLASSSKLGSPDGASLNALLKAQAAGRDQTILDQASDAEQQAKREASRADDYGKTRLQAELSGSCSSFKG